MTNMALKFAATVFAAAAVVAAQAQSVEVSFRPEKSRYARGETFNLVLTVRDSAGRKMPYTEVYFTQYVKSTGSYKDIGHGWTNGAGEAVLSYRVPTGNLDNIYIGGDGWTDWGWAHNERRIPIGL